MYLSATLFEAKRCSSKIFLNTVQRRQNVVRRRYFLTTVLLTVSRLCSSRSTYVETEKVKKEPYNYFGPVSNVVNWMEEKLVETENEVQMEPYNYLLQFRGNRGGCQLDGARKKLPIHYWVKFAYCTVLHFSQSNLLLAGVSMQ